MAGLFPRRDRRTKAGQSRRVGQDRRRRIATRSETAIRPQGERLEGRALLALAVLETSTAWKVSAAEPAGQWTAAFFNDSAFVTASQLGVHTLDGGNAGIIWGPGSPAPSEIWLRGTITLDGRPASTTLDAFADDDMELFVNGVRFVNDANSSPTTLTNIDVTSALAAGTNVIAARVANFGGDSGFAARLEIDTERPDAGDTLATALNTGVVPGMHIGGVTLA